MPQTICRARLIAPSLPRTRQSSPVATSKMRCGNWNGGRLSGFSPDNFLLGRTQMLAKYMTAGLVGSALLATVAFAQNPTATTDSAKPAPAPAAASDSSFQGNWRASKIVGLSVYNDNNESLGSINDLLTDKSGNIKAVGIGGGGFLGVGEHLVAIPFDNIKFPDQPVAYNGASNGPKAPAPPPPSSSLPGATTTNTGPAAAH